MNPEVDFNEQKKIDLKAIAVQIEEGYAQSERGELIDSDQAIRILHARHAEWLRKNPRPPAS
jgi:hypothetical protein